MRLKLPSGVKDGKRSKLMLFGLKPARKLVARLALVTVPLIVGSVVIRSEAEDPVSFTKAALGCGGYCESIWVKIDCPTDVERQSLSGLMWLDSSAKLPVAPLIWKIRSL